MENSIFTKIVDQDTLFVFLFEGECDSPYGQGSPLSYGILTKEAGYFETKMNVPPGPFTKVPSLEFQSAMKHSIANEELLQKMWNQQKGEEKKRSIAYREWMIEQMSKGEKGWYEVSLKYAVEDIKNGGHKWKSFSGRVIAEHSYSAYLKAVSEIVNLNGFWEEEPYNAEINYIGVITDEYLIENGEEK